MSAANANQGGVGFIVTLSMDQNIRLYDIARNKAECLMTLKHQCHIGSLSLSPDNSLLAVGGQNQDIYVWSLKDQKLIRSFFNPSASLENAGNEFDANSKAVFDINWSSDGTMVAAGFERCVVMLDMRKILSQPADAGLDAPPIYKGTTPGGSVNPTLSSLGPSGDGGSQVNMAAGLNGSN